MKQPLRSPLLFARLWAITGLISFSCLCLLLIVAPPSAGASSAGTNPPEILPSVGGIQGQSVTAGLNTSEGSVLPSPTVFFSPSETSLPIEPSATPGTAPGSIQVEFIDVGQGLAVLIIAADGQAALFDGGPVDAGPAVLMELNKHGVKQLELLINSHPHEDHLGGLIDVLKNVPVSKIITNGQPHTTAVYERFLDAALATDAEYIEAALGSSFLLGGIVLQVYSPPLPQPAGDLNRNSLVLHFRWGEAGFLLMGDADQEAEMAILASGLDVRANVLQAGHHCSSKSTSRVFLQSVRPEYAVCSEGAGNSYGHPHAETLRALVDVGASVFRTDISGSIVFITDGANLSVQEEK